MKLDKVPSTLIFLLVRFKIAAISLILPMSIAHICYKVLRQTSMSTTTGAIGNGLINFTTFMEIWAIVEILFYFCFLYSLRRLRNTKPIKKHQYQTTSKQRRELFLKCMLSVDDIERFLSGWFLGADICEIYRENLKDFLAWAFFYEDYEAMRQNLGSECGIRQLDDLNWMVCAFDRKFELNMKPGRNPNVQCMRLNLDRLEPIHKPFFYYFLLYTLEFLFSIVLQRLSGFKKYRSRGEQELLAYWGQDCPEELKQNRTKVSYWYRPATSFNPKMKPLVFIHGIGVGLFGYFTFFRKLWSQYDAQIFVAEMPHVLTRLFPFYQPVIEDVPSDYEMVLALESMLNRHSVDERIGATFVGHSLGSTVVTWMVKHRPALVKRAIFIDPVCFLLYYPDVSHSFCYRSPIDTASWLIWYFCSKELHVSWTLNACFYWHQNVLFPQDFPENCEVSVFFGGKDYIIPGYEILETLKLAGAKEVSIDEPLPLDALHSMRLYFYHGLNHAEFLIRPKEETDVVKIILGHKPDCGNLLREKLPSFSTQASRDSAYDSSDESVEHSPSSQDDMYCME